MPNCGNFDPEIFLKCKLEKQLGVGIRHNKNPYDLPDLEFELNEKKIGIEVMQVMKKMGDDNSKRWLEIIDRDCRALYCGVVPSRVLVEQLFNGGCNVETDIHEPVACGYFLYSVYKC